MPFSRDEQARGVYELDLSTRANNCLKSANIEFIRDLVRCAPDRLLGIRNLGRKSLDEILEALARHRRSLGIPRDNPLIAAFYQRKKLAAMKRVKASMSKPEKPLHKVILARIFKDAAKALALAAARSRSTHQDEKADRELELLRLSVLLDLEALRVWTPKEDASYVVRRLKRFQERYRMGSESTAE